MIGLFIKSKVLMFFFVIKELDSFGFILGLRYFIFLKFSVKIFINKGVYLREEEFF